MIEKKGRRFCLGDLHGNHKGLMQVLERSNFDYENDLLISLGDIADGWNEVSECVSELLKIKNLIVVKGNHDDWFIHWLNRGSHPCDWLQGGLGTLQSYANNTITGREVPIIPHFGAFTSDLNYLDIPTNHVNFWNSMKNFYVLDNKVFVHGGFDRYESIYTQKPENLYWNRSMFTEALSYKSVNKKSDNNPIPFSTVDNFDEIYIGHTTTQNWNTMEPINAANVWNLDTGGGWSGKLTIMNIDTKEFFQSDIVTDLYKNERGRNS